MEAQAEIHYITSQVDLSGNLLAGHDYMFDSQPKLHGYIHPFPRERLLHRVFIPPGRRSSTSGQGSGCGKCASSQAY